MNFKIALLVLILIVGCGVKSPPLPPEGSSIESVVDRLSTEDSTTEKKSE